MLILYFVHPWFAWRTPKNPKILFSLHGAARIARMMWRNPFRHWSTQSSCFSQNDQNTPGQPWVDRKSNKVKILTKQKFSWFYIKPELFRDFQQFWPSLTQSWLLAGPKTLILIQLSKRVEHNATAKIIKF